MRSTLMALLVFCCSTTVALSQRTAPITKCVSGDTLRWIMPTDPCGPLTSITVHASSNENGPYDVLGTVALPDSFFLTSAAERATYSYFYFTATYNGCTPPDSPPSDTVTTAPLPIPRIRGIDYDNLGTTLTWDPVIGDDRTTAYLVYKETDMGTTLIDTVVGTSYLDPLTAVEGQGAIYYLGSLDGCNVSSFSATPYSSFITEVDRDACNSQLTLTSRFPIEWPHPFVESFVVRRTIGGNIDTIPVAAGDTIITLTDLSPDTSYSVRVTYIDDEGGTTTSINADVPSQRVVAADIIEIAELTFDPTGWQVRWRWNARAGYSNTRWEIRRGSTVIETQDIPDDLNILPAPTVALGIARDFDWSNAELVVISTDVCGVERTSPVAKPALLNPAELDVFTVNVDWSLPVHELATFNEWDLRFVDTIGSVLIFTSENETTFLHDVSQINIREACYQLVTRITLPAVFDRPAQNFTWRSYPTCELRTPRVYLPTGFVPEGFSVEYRPRVSLTEGLDYRFSVFDRWGKMLFDTNDRFEGWTGFVNGKPVAPGLYLAVVELTEPNRSPIRIEGPITLIR